MTTEEVKKSMDDAAAEELYRKKYSRTLATLYPVIDVWLYQHGANNLKQAAKIFDIPYSTLRDRLYGMTEFRLDEIRQILRIMEMSFEEVFNSIEG